MKERNTRIEQREIEVKLDATLGSNEFILKKAEEILISKGWKFVGKREDVKNLTYYDTSDFDFYRIGITVREITPFIMPKFPGIARYDLKKGNLESRTETKIWSTKLLSGREILSLLGIDEFKEIEPKVEVTLTPFFVDFEKQGTGVELKLDVCYQNGEILFRELEVELKYGDSDEVYACAEEFIRYFGFKKLNKQKYNRIIERLAIGGNDD